MPPACCTYFRIHPWKKSFGRAAQKAKDRNATSWPSLREVRATGTFAPMTTPQVLAWACICQHFTIRFHASRLGATMPSNSPHRGQSYPFSRAASLDKIRS